MSEMLSIGQFARAAGLSPRALRSYDECNLLRPAAVDDLTGYRWYLPSQLRQGELIRLGRSLDMPLAVLRQLLADRPEQAHIRVDQHLRYLARRAAGLRSVASQFHRLIDGDDPREVDRMDVQAIVLYVDDLPASMQFYGAQLDLPIVFEHAGRTAYQVGASRLLLHPRGEGLDYPKRTDGEVTGRGVELSLGVEDVDRLTNQLREGGVDVRQDPTDQPWGERDAVVADPDGFTVRLSQSRDDTWLQA